MITLLILAIMIGIILLVLGVGLSDPIICILIIVAIYKCIKKIRSKKANGD